MKTIEQIAAEILVECGYATEYGYYDEEEAEIIIHHPSWIGGDQLCNPFADTLEGRRQSDAIEDWLSDNKSGIWSIDSIINTDERLSNHDWRLDRIKWCLEQLRPERTAKTAPQTD